MLKELQQPLGLLQNVGLGFSFSTFGLGLCYQGLKNLSNLVFLKMWV
jgi:hypothetical protein